MANKIIEKSLLPLDARKVLPIAFKDDESPRALALVREMERFFQSMHNDIEWLNYPYDCSKVRTSNINELIYQFDAQVSQTADERQKRIAICSAVAKNKSWTLFGPSMKGTVDSICGGDSYIVLGLIEGDFILLGDGLNETEDWGIQGTPGDEWGLTFGGYGFVVTAAGIVYIDVQNSALTPDEIELLEASVTPECPAYYEVHFGYFDGDLIWNDYFIVG